MKFRILSIGTLSHHELWDRPQAPRTAHATTVLIESEGKRLLVDPGLPGQVIAARLGERAGLSVDDIDMVFLTNFKPSHRRGLAIFGKSKWYLSEQERSIIGGKLVEDLEHVEDEETRQLYRQEITTLRQCEASPDQLLDQVDLFPLYGFTPGTCGLILAEPKRTVVVAGDAVPTVEHMDQRRVGRGAGDVEQAKESLEEALEIADAIIPGHDNLVMR